MEQLVRAPGLEAGNLCWYNTKTPLDWPGLEGKLIVLDFWTFCCINCIHVLPTLKRLERTYPDDLLVIGVHSPKFPSEKNPENLAHAIRRYEIEHPVVHDPEFSIWKKYAVRAWPTLVVISPEGYVLGQLSGEPEPQLFLETFQKLIEDMRTKGKLAGNAADLLAPPAAAGDTALKFPGKIAYSDADREFAIADSNHNQIVTADAKGNLTRKIGTGKAGHQDGALEDATFFRPQGLCYRDGVIWVADTENHLIRKIDLKEKFVSTVAGTGTQGGVLKDPGPARNTALSSPWDVSLHRKQLFFANAGTHQIGVYDLKEHTAGNFAGTGQESLIDGPRFHGAFAQPSGLSIGDDKLFLADSETSAVRSIHLDQVGFIETYIGTGLFDFGDQDGKGNEAVLQHPLGLHYAQGKVYIADSYNNKIKALDLETQEVSTVRASVDLQCNETRCTRLGEPAGVLKLNHSLYVSDTNHHRIVKIDLETERSEIFIE